MDDTTVILSKLNSLSAKTMDAIKQSEDLSSKLTALALSPHMEGFDKNKKGGIYAAIGVTSMRIVQLKALLEDQKTNNTKIRVIEFLTVPLVIIKKFLGISSRTSKADEY